MECVLTFSLQQRVLTKKPKNIINFIKQIQRVRRKSLRGVVGSGAGRGENFTGGWTKGLLLVENSVSHQGVTLLHTD
jgi:hypothetical protein